MKMRNEPNAQYFNTAICTSLAGCFYLIHTANSTLQTLLALNLLTNKWVCVHICQIIPTINSNLNDNN